jgi:DNA-directed RNA polymerase I, II, and III subunit RPABC1
MTCVSVATVNRIKKNLNKNGDMTPQRKGHCGRKRLTTPRDERKIRDICLENRNKPRRILTALIQDAGIPVSRMTVRRRLKEQGFRCCRPAKKPKLTPAMQQKRLAWAKSHRHLTVEDWKNVSNGHS